MSNAAVEGALFARRTQRLLMRKLVAEDLDELVALDADPEVMRHISDGRPTPRSEFVETLLPRILSWPADDPVAFFRASPERVVRGEYRIMGRSGRYDTA